MIIPHRREGKSKPSSKPDQKTGIKKGRGRKKKITHLQDSSESAAKDELRGMTYSETVDVLQGLKYQSITLEPRHFQLLGNKKVSRSFLKGVLLYLVRLDSEISSITPGLGDIQDIHLLVDMKEKTKQFSVMFNLLFDNMEHVDLDYFFFLYDKYVIAQQTKHIHFLLFGVPDSQRVLVFLLLSTKRCAIPLFASFYSRHSSRNQKALHKFVLRMKEDPLYIHSLMYILCFVRDDRVGELLMATIKNKKNLFLNKKVVHEFNAMYGTKIDCFESQDELLNYFPLDEPEIESIKMKIKDRYVKKQSLIDIP